MLALEHESGKQRFPAVEMVHQFLRLSQETASPASWGGDAWMVDGRTFRFGSGETIRLGSHAPLCTPLDSPLLRPGGIARPGSSRAGECGLLRPRDVMGNSSPAHTATAAGGVRYRGREELDSRAPVDRELVALRTENADLRSILCHERHQRAAEAEQSSRRLTQAIRERAKRQETTRRLEDGLYAERVKTARILKQTDRIEEQLAQVRGTNGFLCARVAELEHMMGAERQIQERTGDLARQRLLDDLGVGFLEEWSTLPEEVVVCAAIAHGGFGSICPLVARSPRVQARVSRVTGGRGVVIKRLIEASPSSSGTGTPPIALGASAGLQGCRDVAYGPLEGGDVLRSEGMRREVSLFRRFFPPLANSNIVDVFGCDPTGSGFVMERMDKDLGTLFVSRTWDDLTVYHKTRLLAQAVAGVRQMHEVGVVHGDVKASNFLVDDALSIVKVTDLGLSAEMGAAPLGGSYDSIAPELSHGGLMGHQEAHSHHLTPAADVYGLGHLVLEGVSMRQGPILPETVLRQRVVPLMDEGIFLEPRYYCGVLERRVRDDPYDADVREALEIAWGNMRRLACIYASTWAKMRLDFLLSREMWPQQRLMRNVCEVSLILRSVLNPDPERRPRMSTLWSLLHQPEIWTTHGDPVPPLCLGMEAQDLVREVMDRLGTEEDDDRDPVWCLAWRWWEQPIPYTAVVPF